MSELLNVETRKLIEKTQANVGSLLENLNTLHERGFTVTIYTYDPKVGVRLNGRGEDPPYLSVDLSLKL